jgi:hypothetical protein
VAPEQAKQEAVKQACIDAEEQPRKEADEQARLEAQEQARKDAEEQARLEAQEQARKDAEEQARLEAQEQVNRAAVRSTISVFNVAIGTNTNVKGGSKIFKDAILPLLQSHSEHHRQCLGAFKGNKSGPSKNVLRSLRAQLERQNALVLSASSLQMQAHDLFSAGAISASCAPAPSPLPLFPYLLLHYLKLKQQLKVGLALSALSSMPPTPRTARCVETILKTVVQPA